MSYQPVIKYVGRNAKLLAFLGGVIMFCFSIIVSIIVIGAFEVDDVIEHQKDLSSLTTDLTHDTNEVLNLLVGKHARTCTAENLLTLQGVLLEYRFFRDIGIYDTLGNLYCSTKMGVLKQAITDDAVSFTSTSGLKIWFDVPLILSRGRIRGVIAKLGDFNVVIDPYVTNSILENQRSFIWFSNKTTRLISSTLNYSEQEIERLKNRALSLDSGIHFSLMPIEIDIISKIKDTVYIIHNNISVMDIIKHSPKISLVTLAMSFLLSLLTNSTLTPRLMKFRTLHYKMRYMCNVDSINCVYQPILELATGKVVGCEVLMRMFDKHTYYSPDEVIPTIVNCDLTWELDRNVTEKALSEIGKHLVGIIDTDFKVAFNFFPADLNFDKLHNHLEAKRIEHKALNFLINIEVTEHNFIGDVLPQIQRFRDAGYLISVDDFGTGYSNLGSLRKTLPNFIKIDKSFIFEMEDISIRSTLIPEIIAIAKAIGAEVIAEGIENGAQAKLLTDLGARYGQGYFFAKPMPIESFLEYYVLKQNSIK